MNNNSEFKPISIRQLLAKAGLIILMIVTSISFLALYVPPQTTVIFQWIGVSLPFLLLCNLLLLVVGIFKRSWYSICPLIAILSNFHYFQQIVQYNRQDVADSAQIRFATYNVHGFKMVYNISSMDQIAEYLSSNKINTICLQEVPADCSIADLKRAFSTMPYVITTGGVAGANQLAILSKYPLDSVKTVSFHERPNCALFADLTINHEKVRIGNCHLQTTNWNQVKGVFISPQYTDRNWYDALELMSSNFKLRGGQVDSLRYLMDDSPYPLLISGDFNNTPISYSYHKIKGDLKDAFRESGNGYGFTYRYFRKLFRIDFVFYSGAKFQSTNYRTGDITYSDHLPVLVDISMH